MLPVVDFYFFSPTGGTKKAGEIFCQSIARKVNYIDLTLPKNNYNESQSDVVVFAAPVYAGRIPTVAAERFSKIKGQGKKVITLVVYGVRGYDDALLELNDLVKAAGFHVVASAALIAQHSIVKEVGTGRPDSKDASAIQAFAKDVFKKLDSASGEISVPGNRPYREGMNVPFSPISLPHCIECGFCTYECPVSAIKKFNGLNTSTDICILCMACVKKCPRNARVLPTHLQDSMNQKLLELKNSYLENQFFL